MAQKHQKPRRKAHSLGTSRSFAVDISEIPESPIDEDNETPPFHLDTIRAEQDLEPYLPRRDDDEFRDSMRIVVPKSMQQSIIAHHHDHALSGHLGSWKTLRNIQRLFTWVGITGDIREYTRQCDTLGLKSPWTS